MTTTSSFISLCVIRYSITQHRKAYKEEEEVCFIGICVMDYMSSSTIMFIKEVVVDK
jgi:glutamine amidotransferase-like uncharacterized protein